MKALTLTQPWASLIAIGAKTIETRSWSTKYRGLLAIHAAKGRPNMVAAAGLYNQGVEKAMLMHAEQGCEEGMPRGVIVATCRLVDVVPTDTMAGFGRITSWGRLGMEDEPPASSDWIDEHDPPCDYGGLTWDLDGNRPLGEFTPGRFAWLLADIRPTSAPVAAKGALGLWEWAT